MASEKLFKDLPPFPEALPVAQIPKIGLAELVKGNQLEAEALFNACQRSGFFLLDLKGDSVGEKMIQEIDGIFGVIGGVMKLSNEEKLKYSQDPPRDLMGYKAQGVMKTETGAPDRVEFFNVGQDDLLGNQPQRSAPEPINFQRSLLTSYIQHGNIVLTTLLQALATQLGLPVNVFCDLHTPSRPSGTTLRLIRYPPSLRSEDMRTALLPHTDYGSVTLLANVLGGLQILAPGSEPHDGNGWLWVRPEPECLITTKRSGVVIFTTKRSGVVIFTTKRSGVVI